MPAQISKFHHNAREATARPFRLRRPFREVREERVNECARLARAWKCTQPLDCQLAGMREGHRHQIVLAGEVLIECALCDTGVGGDFVHRHPQKTLAPKQAERGIEDA